MIHSLTRRRCIFHPINESIDQSTNQSTNQSINQPISQIINQSISHRSNIEFRLNGGELRRAAGCHSSAGCPPMMTSVWQRWMGPIDYTNQTSRGWKQTRHKNQTEASHGSLFWLIALYGVVMATPPPFYNRPPLIGWPQYNA